MHFDPDQLDWQPIGDGWQRAELRLGRGDSAWNPASTKPERAIWGPVVVTYDRAPDGGVTAIERSVT